MSPEKTEKGFKVWASLVGVFLITLPNKTEHVNCNDTSVRIAYAQ